MQYPLLSEYVSAITHASENLDQLKHLEVVQDEHGEPYRSSGAFAVVFKMRDPRTGQLYALKCFTEEQEGRAEAYRKIEEELEVAGTTYLTSMRYYERELFVDSSVSSESEFPVLLMDWVEGSTMELYIREHYRDSYAMEMLCYRFCRLAAYLRSQPFAHGDVKPDNIMVFDTGTLTLIDYDGMFVPSMQGESSPTLGTEEFRHPLRTPELFDATIDDFALASIALSLRAIALDSQLLDQYGAPDRLLFSASDYRDLAQSKVMQAIWRLVGDKDLCKLVGLFVLAHAEQSLASTSFQLFSTTRPEKPVVVPLSTKVTDEDLAEAYTDEYGVKFSPDRKRLLKAPRDLVSYTIPSTVTAICDGAFYWCLRLSSLTIPNSVTTIGNRAFSRNRHFTSLTIPNSVTSIGDSAFESCSSLTSLTIPNSVTSIGNAAFWGCSSLTLLTISDSVTSIGNSAFSCCESLTTLTIPASVTTIGANPFSKLNLQLDNRSPHFYVKDNVLFTADKKKLIAYCSTQTSYSISDSVTSIGDKAFCGCDSLTSLTIPNSVTSIGHGAFCGCDSLASLTIPDSVTSIGDSAFSWCSSLTSLTIPNSVTSIGEWAFSRCLSLTSLTIPNSVTSISNSAFEDCSSITSLTIPESITSIGYSAFEDCSSLTSLTIPNSVTSIEEWAFSGCECLTSLTIPNSVTSIGKGAFGDCSSLTSLAIPDSVTFIGDCAFYKCKSLTALTISASVTTIGDSTFSGCSSLTSLTIPNSVTTIGDEAFSGCKGLTSLTISDSVTSIGNSAFEYCKSLTSLTIPNSVTSMGQGTLYGCDNLNQSTREELEDRFGKRIFERY
ncbi:leucine-rich repeat protein [Porphyromonas sp.]|uniref:leucine-rich repeat protein n=1 Tax=Porphyromonas sp. TaxID=1924944 RepID=UPI003A908F10